MKSEIRITQLKRGEVEDLFKLQDEFRDYLEGLGGKRGMPARERRRTFIKDCFGRDPAFSCIIARNGTIPLGYLCYHFGYDPDEAEGRVVYVIDLFVTEKARGLKVGESLMRTAARICLEKQGMAVYFCVWRRNKAAIGFYRHLGADWVKDVPLMLWPKGKWRT